MAGVARSSVCFRTGACFLWIPLHHPNSRTWGLPGRAAGFCDLSKQLPVFPGQSPQPGRPLWFLPRHSGSCPMSEGGAGELPGWIGTCGPGHQASFSTIWMPRAGEAPGAVFPLAPVGVGGGCWEDHMFAFCSGCGRAFNPCLQLDVELLPFLTVIDKAVSACGTLGLCGPCFLTRGIYKLCCWATGPKA